MVIILVSITVIIYRRRFTQPFLLLENVWYSQKWFVVDIVSHTTGHDFNFLPEMSNFLVSGVKMTWPGKILDRTSKHTSPYEAISIPVSWFFSSKGQWN